MGKERVIYFGGEDIENSTNQLIKSINDLNVQLTGFRAEMKEFKKSVDKRIDSLDSRQFQCQVNPMSCANARKLEEHIKSEAGKSGRITGIIACGISCFNVAVTVIAMVVKSL